MLDWVMIMLLCVMLWERMHLRYMVVNSMGIFPFGMGFLRRPVAVCLLGFS